MPTRPSDDALATDYQNAAISQANAAVEDNPDDAGRAYQLEQSTGIPGGFIHQDLEKFENDYKSAATAHLIRNNPALVEYVHSHPLAASVSADDWDHLDSFSQKLKYAVAHDPITAAVKGFHEGYNEAFPQDWYLSQDTVAKYPRLSAISMMTMAPFEAPFRAFSGAMVAFERGATASLAPLIGESQAEQAAADLRGYIETRLGLVPGVEGQVMAQHYTKQLKESARVTGPYVAAGKLPPTGADPIVDGLKAKIAEKDAETIKDLLNEAAHTNTRERSPELIKKLTDIVQRTPSTIGIEADAVRALYGDKEPTPEDGLLGWVPGIRDQLATAAQTGGDVTIPLSDWLSRMEPEVANELLDYTRVRPAGVTLNEAKTLKPALTSKADEFGEFQIGKEQEADLEGRLAAREPPTEPMSTEEFEREQKTGEGLGGVSVKEPPPLSAKEKAQLRWGVLLSSVRRAAGWETAGGVDAQPSLELKGLKPIEFETQDIAGTKTIKLTGRVTSVGSALRQIKAGGYLESSYSRIAGRINTAAGDVPIHVVSDADWEALGDKEHKAGGIYSSYFDHIVIPESTLNNLFHAKRIILHEAVHAATHKALEDNPVLKNSIAAIIGEIIAKTPEASEYYGFHPEYHEFLTEAFTNAKFQKLLGEHNISPELAKALHMRQWEGKTWWKGLLETVARFFNLDKEDYTALEAAIRVGDLATTLQAREKSKVFAKVAPLAAQREPELPGMTRMEDREVFEKAAAVGMTVKQYERYQQLIEKQRAEDKEFFDAQALKEEEKRQTAEWKENSKKIREQVKADVTGRPDIAADEFLRTGTLFGDKIKGRWRINQEYLSDEDKAAIPDDYYGKTGLHPDDVAQLFGFDSGRSLIDSIRSLQESRGELGPNQYINKLVEQETNAQMARQFGDLPENILRAAQEHVVSPTQLDLLHEDMVRLGTAAGSELPIQKDQVKAWARSEFAKLPSGSVSLETMLRDAGKAGKLTELALLEGNATEAFRQKQRQYLNALMAAEAKKFDKEKKAFDRLAKRYEKRPDYKTPGSIDNQYVNFIQDILMRVGKPVKRTPEDLQQEIKAAGVSNTLEKFVTEKVYGDMREVPVADFLFDPNYKKPIGETSVEDFRAIHNSLKTLEHNGRDERKVDKDGEKEDLDKIKSQMIEQLRTFKEKFYDAEGGRWSMGFIPPKIAAPIRTFLASHLQLESLFNRFDRGDRDGVFTQYVMRDLTSAANDEAKKEKAYSKRVAALADKIDLKEQIPNNVFIDPWTIEGPEELQRYIPMTRKNLRAVLQYVGSPSGLDKLARGYQADPNLIMQWVHKHALKEDWDWAQKQGDIFADLKEESDRMYRRISGIAPEKIDIQPLQTPHGTYRGWYHPIVYHPLWEGTSKKILGGDALEEPGYFRATPPAGYTVKRTGYAAPLDLDLDVTPSRMKQMIHDISFREAVINASKIFYDKGVRQAIKQHYGAEYADQLVPYIKDVANYQNTKSGAAAMYQRWSEFFRQNMIGTLIGFNPGTVLKHGPTAWVNSITEVGPKLFLKHFLGMFTNSDFTADSNWTFARDTSEELQRRIRHYQDTLRGTTETNLGKASWREAILAAGAKPVAWSDLMSAVPTWLAQYEKSMNEHGVHGDAVQEADRAVRRAHGSSAITSRPAIMRDGNPWLTSLYGFWSHITNRQYEMLWQAKDALQGRGAFTDADISERAKAFSKTATVGLMSYVIAPAIIEQLVSPMFGDEKDSFAWRWAKALFRTTTAGIIIGRDLAYALVEQRDPAAGLISASGKALTDLGRDLSKKDMGFDRPRAAKTLRDGVTALGAVTGFTNAQEGKELQALMDYYYGKHYNKRQPPPRTYTDWLMALAGKHR